jgi:hypothetical protein
VDGDDPDRAVAREQRHVERRRRAELPRVLLRHLRVVDQRVHPLAAAALQDARRLRLRRELELRHVGRDVACGGCDPHAAARRRQPDQDDARLEQLAQPGGDELEQARKVQLPGERVADLRQRLELARPARRRLVQARILDRDGRLRREQHDEILVLLGELALDLLRQVQVAPGDAADQDRHAEEAAHRRVAGREADGSRILTEVVEPQRPRVGDQRAEDAAPARQFADDGARLRGEAGRQEPLESRAGRVDDAEGGVARAGDGGGGLDDVLEERVERELGAEGDAGLDEPAQPSLGLGRGHSKISRVSRGTSTGRVVSTAISLPGRSAPSHSRASIRRRISGAYASV